nr:hypothetical protein [Clostridia bacterium]
MEEMLKNANLSVKDELTDKTHPYKSPLIEIKAFKVGDIIVMSPGDIGGDNPFGDDFN